MYGALYHVIEAELQQGGLLRVFRVCADNVESRDAAYYCQSRQYV